MGAIIAFQRAETETSEPGGATVQCETVSWRNISFTLIDPREGVLSEIAVNNN